MAQINADEITQLLKEQIQNYDAEISVDEVGTIISLGDGIARLHGLDKAMAGEMLKFPHGVEGLAMNRSAASFWAITRSCARETRSSAAARL
jgi:F-type H+-transporting ATPase subunit alpha